MTRKLSRRGSYSKRPAAGGSRSFAWNRRRNTTVSRRPCCRPGRSFWKCLIGGASKWKAGQVLSRRIDRRFPMGTNAETSQEIKIASGRVSDFNNNVDSGTSLLLEARWIGKLDDCFLIEFSWTPPELSFAELLHQAGLIPIAALYPPCGGRG